MSQQCIALTANRTQCSRAPTWNSETCWQHQGCQETALITDLGNIMGEYLDLATYKKLISVDNKIYTLEKYHKLQEQYEKNFAEELRSSFNEEYNSLLDSLNLLSNSDKKSYIRNQKFYDGYIHLINTYILKILDDLNFLDLFITTHKSKRKPSSKLSICSIFEGYLNEKFGKLQFSDSGVKILMGRKYMNELHFYLTFLDDTYDINPKELTPLFKLLWDLHVFYINRKSI